MLGFFTKKRGITLIEHERSKSVRRNESFTLIELLVVVAIIGLLISVILVSFGPPRKEAKDAKRQVDIKQIGLVMNLCYDDSNCGTGVDRYISTTGGANAVTTIGTYLPSVPFDPVNSSPYEYTWKDNSGDTTEYCVYTKLEAQATDTWIAVSHKGARMDLNAEPLTIADCW